MAHLSRRRRCGCGGKIIQNCTTEDGYSDGYNVVSPPFSIFNNYVASRRCEDKLMGIATAGPLFFCNTGAVIKELPRSRFFTVLSTPFETDAYLLQFTVNELRSFACYRLVEVLVEDALYNFPIHHVMVALLPSTSRRVSILWNSHGSHRRFSH